MDVWGISPVTSFVHGDSLGRAVQDFNALPPEGDFLPGGVPPSQRGCGSCAGVGRVMMGCGM